MTILISRSLSSRVKTKNCLRLSEKKYDHIEAIGYTDRVDYYMKKADIIVTKAGGITTFEAIASKTPLYVIKPFLEQEFGNAKYIEEHNIGRVLWNKDSDEIEDIVNLIHNDKLLETMKENMSKLIEEFEHSDLYKDTKKEMEKCS
ncbi:glycosyltransferase [Emergencia timonensis]|uniref:glycosyltransferase n=1 Tax=Emergencia timonensis TaxID=1776384 RepID=UPI00295AB90D|nr:glycosyltransferase [Emergencia timonensis]WNX86820.1 glycosyltransferase [Emergencia timonensis]